MAGTNQKAGSPFIEFPDEVKIKEDNGGEMTFCWLEHERVCTGGCQSFDPLYADDETGRFTSCRLVNIAMSAASALSSMASPVKGGTVSHDIPGINIKPPEVK